MCLPVRLRASYARACSRSGEEGVADRSTGLSAGGNREDRTARVEQVLVEEVVGREPRLDREELAAGVLLEAEEEEAGAHLTDRVDPLREVVAPAQDSLPLAVGPGARVRETNVRGD